VKYSHRSDISENAIVHLCENKKSNIPAGLLKKQLFAPSSKLESLQLFYTDITFLEGINFADPFLPS
jgi:hypothetical protein